MSKPFDTTLNTLVEIETQEWAGFFGALGGIPPGPAVVLDTDLSVSAQADKLFRLDGEVPGILHLEFESGGGLGMPAELLRYNSLVYLNLRLPVHTVVVLLRPSGNPSDLTGELIVRKSNGQLNVMFCYTVVRVWEQPIERWLDAGLGMTPLAILTNDAARDLPAAMERMRVRLQDRLVPVRLRDELISAAFVLCGLRYPREEIDTVARIMAMAVNMEESTSYQWILEKGEAKGMANARRKDLLAILRKRFGVVPSDLEHRITHLDDPELLQKLMLILFDCQSFDEFAESLPIF